MLAPELRDADALVSAQTGSGKTVAFGLALAPTLLDGADKFLFAAAPQALVVAPTRELALQVKREIDWLYAGTGASVTSCVGGMDMRTERRELQRGANIVVGTPGRLRDHIERGSFDTSELKAVVLDEADEMLDLGFRDDLEYILDAAPDSRRTLMFSATVPRSIAGLAKRYQRDAVRVSTKGEQEQHLDIEYRALTVAPNDRENAIINVLRFYEAKNALVFCGTRAMVNRLTSRFTNRGFSVVALSGELSQNERTHALQAMRDGRARVCVATDVAARGIDLPNLELVIHADLPKNKESLLHRSGRTGRAGRKGVCTLIVPHSARKRTDRLLNSAKIKAEWARPPSADDIVARDRMRILDDPSLSEALNDDEKKFAADLLERHDAEHIAAAFVRLHLAGRTAPEELLDNSPVEGKAPRRDDFKNGVWFSLTVGRDQRAEPRWLLPLLCRAGHVTKNEIGRIRIHQTETHVELKSDCVEAFVKTMGPSGKLDDSITMTRLDGEPKVPSGGRSTPGPKSGAKSGYGSKPASKPRSKPKAKYEPKIEAEPAPRAKLELKHKERPKPAAQKEKEWNKSDGEKFVKEYAEKKPADKASKKKRNKKPDIPKRAKPHAKNRARPSNKGKPGSGPLKRRSAPKRSD